MNGVVRIFSGLVYQTSFVEIQSGVVRETIESCFATGAMPRGGLDVDRVVNGYCRFGSRTGIREKSPRGVNISQDRP